MTPHELWVLKKMWDRGFPLHVMADSLGISVGILKKITKADFNMFKLREKKSIKW